MRAAVPGRPELGMRGQVEELTGRGSSCLGSYSRARPAPTHLQTTVLHQVQLRRAADTGGVCLASDTTYQG